MFMIFKMILMNGINVMNHYDYINVQPVMMNTLDQYYHKNYKHLCKAVLLTELIMVWFIIHIYMSGLMVMPRGRLPTG